MVRPAFRARRRTFTASTLPCASSASRKSLEQVVQASSKSLVPVAVGDEAELLQVRKSAVEILRLPRNPLGRTRKRSTWTTRPRIFGEKEKNPGAGKRLRLVLKPESNGCHSAAGERFTDRQASGRFKRPGLLASARPRIIRVKEKNPGTNRAASPCLSGSGVKHNFRLLSEPLAVR